MGARVAAVLVCLWTASAFAQPLPLPPRPASNEPLVVGVEMHFYGAYADASSAAELRRKLSKLVSVHKGQPLVPSEVRRSIELLFETDTLADVVARAEDASGGVRVIFEVTPKRRIAQVAVEGNRVLTDEDVVAAAKLEPGSEYYPERVTAAVEVVTQQYRRRGYNQVKIGTQAFELPNGLELVLNIEEGEPTRLSAVTVGGSPGLPLLRILTALDLQLGQVLDLERLDGKLEQLRALYRAEKYYRAQVSQPAVIQKGKGAQLLLPISAGPKYEVQFRGSRSMPDSILLPALGYDGTESLEPSLIGRLARRLELFYRYRGYHDVRVRAREVPSPNRSQAVLVFEVEEGLPLLVEQIDFVGNKAVSTRELRQILMDVLAASEPVVTPPILLTDDPLEAEGREAHEPIVAPRPNVSSVLIEEAYRQAAEVMTSYFRDRGFLQAKVSVESIDIDVAARRVKARFLTEEGVQTLIESVKYAGLPTSLGVKAPGGVKQGQPLSYATMEQERAKLVQALGRKGHIFARVEANAELSADSRAARVAYAVDPGPRVLVGQVIVRGLVQSSEPMVRGNLRLHEGDVLDSEMLFESQRNLVTMEIFRQATVQLLRPDVVEARKDILVEVRERATLTGDFSLGYSVVDGVRSTIEGLRPNLFGRGVNLVGRLKLAVYAASSRVIFDEGGQDRGFLDLFGWQANISFIEPRLVNLIPGIGPEVLKRIGLRGDIIFENVARPSYRFTRFSTVAGFDFPLLKNLSASLQAEFEIDDVFKVATLSGGQRVDAIDQQRLRFPEGRFVLLTARAPVALDLRDDPLNPRSGWLFSISPELIGDVGGQNINLWRLAGAATRYQPLIGDFGLALSVRAGLIVPRDPEARSIGPKRFFLGGSNSMRGFREDGLIPEDRRVTLRRDITSCRTLLQPQGCTPEADRLQKGEDILSEGGDVFVLGRSELRVPLFGAWGLTAFFELGNLWLDQSQFDAAVLRKVAGAGLRYMTPVGPATLDIGFIIGRDVVVGEPQYNVNFSLGAF